MTEYVEVARVTEKDFPFQSRCLQGPNHWVARGPSQAHCTGAALAHVQMNPGHEVVIEERKG